MKKLVKTGAAALMLTCMAGNVWAAAAGAAGCARPEDLSALKAAALQQRLMVAALSCDAIAAYNTFVKSFQKDLQASDRALQNFFRRLSGATGTERYHAYKTHLANTSSMESIGNITNYCAGAKASFDAQAAQTAAKSGLQGFLSTQAIAVEDVYKPCEIITAGASTPLQNVPMPRMKPAGDVVVPAQGGALAPN